MRLKELTKVLPHDLDLTIDIAQYNQAKNIYDFIDTTIITMSQSVTDDTDIANYFVKIIIPSEDKLNIIITKEEN